MCMSVWSLSVPLKVADEDVLCCQTLTLFVLLYRQVCKFFSHFRNLSAVFSGPENSSVLRLLIHLYERMSSFVCLVGWGERGRRLYVFIAVYFTVS